MDLSFEEFVSVLKGLLAAEERLNAVVYAVETPLAAGSKLEFPGIHIEVPKEAYLAFVDRQPLANWGHSARYVLIRRDGGEPVSFETRLPPFGPDAKLKWRIVYQAPSAPDAAAKFPGRVN